MSIIGPGASATVVRGPLLTAPGSRATLALDTQVGGNPSPTAVYMVGFADRGPVGVPIELQRNADVRPLLGGRNDSLSQLTVDSLEAAFGEGADRVYFSRIGHTATVGTLSLSDGSHPTVRVDAAWPGADSANIKVKVTAGSATGLWNLLLFDLTVSATDPVEVYPDLGTNITAAAQVVNLQSGLVHLTDLASASAAPNNIPSTTGPTALSAGSDGRGSATDSDVGAALAALVQPQLGFGLVIVPGRYSSSIHALVAAHCVATGREGIVDTAGPDANGNPMTVADAETLAAADASNPGHLRNGDATMIVGPWATLDPLPGTSLVRTVPLSAAVAGLKARTDADTGHAARGPFGRYGKFRYVTGLASSYTEAQRIQLNGQTNVTGICVARDIGDGPTLYGWRTTAADPSTYQGGPILEALLLDDLAQNIADTYVGRTDDGRGTVEADCRGDLEALFLDHWNKGGLSGLTKGDAFGVTDVEISGLSLVASGWTQPADSIERVYFQLTSKVQPV